MQPCPIVLADEIDAALDVDKVRLLGQLLRRLTAEKEMQVLMITHKQDVIGESRQLVGTYYVDNSTHIVTAAT